MSNEETLKAGISAAKSGDLDRAAVLFAEVVRVDPSSEQGWLWLGMCLSNPDRREYCFRRVLALNPNNPDARTQLEKLAGPGEPPPPPVSPFQTETPQKSTPPPVSPFKNETSQKPEPSPVSPFRTEASQRPTPSAPVQALYTSQPLRYTFPEDETPHAAGPFFHEPEPVPVAAAVPAVQEEYSTSPSDTPGPKAAPKKKRNNLLLLVMGLAATLTVCGAITVVLFLSGAMNGLLGGNIPFLAMQPIPTALTLPTLSASPTAAPEPTQVAPTSLPTALPTPKPEVSYTPTLEKVNCPFEIPAGAHVTCSYAIVPEDRTGDPTHTIHLMVAVYRSTSQNPAPDPVLFLQGGPGGEAVKLITGYYKQLVVPILKSRDFIVYDQRGTGLSDPALNCDELSKAYLQDVEGLIPSTTRSLVYSNALGSCNGLMSAKGINLNAYTTVESAADIRDILSLLGYQSVDLYGASYGTRLAQVVMRDYPGIVHSAILDSVVPVETNFFVNYPQGMEAGLKTLFDACAADAACNAAYPNLEAVFWDLLTRLDAKPVSLTTSNPRTGTVVQSVDGSTIMNIILGSIKTSELINTAPQSIYRFKNGDYSPLIATQSSLPFGFEGINIGLYISMMCHEHILATTPDQLQATTVSSKDIEEYAWLPFYGSAKDIFKTCESWKATGPSLGENAALNSAIPSLVITGKFDPTTPPMYAQQVAGHLSHSYYFEFSNQGHVPTATDTTGCAMNTVIAFLNDPNTAPDRFCLNNMGSVHFLTPYTGSPALSLTKMSSGGMTGRVPNGWVSTGDGFFFRNNSPFDITSIGFFEAILNATDLKTWFSLKAYGFRGLDTALVPAGDRSANNLKWSLLTTTSYGRPVDVAIADYRGRSLVVMLFSNSDEHDALYQNAFLPLIDSAQP